LLKIEKVIPKHTLEFKNKLNVTLPLIDLILPTSNCPCHSPIQALYINQRRGTLSRRSMPILYSSQGTSAPPCQTLLDPSQGYKKDNVSPKPTLPKEINKLVVVMGGDHADLPIAVHFPSIHNDCFFCSGWGLLNLDTPMNLADVETIKMIAGHAHHQHHEEEDGGHS
jgi:hypothetical protein